MAKLLVLFLLCLSSVYSEPIMLKTLTMNKEMMPGVEKMETDPVMVETAMAKPKRDSYPYHHSTPCPPFLNHINKGWQSPAHNPHVQFIHQPTVIQKPVIVKPHVPYHQPGWNSGWNSGWQDPWKQGWQSDPWKQGWNQGWSKPSHGWNPGWNQGWDQGWSKPSHGWNQGWSNPGWGSSGWQKPGWQQPVVIKQPSWPSSYAPGWQNPHKPVWQAPQLIKPAVVVKPDCPPWQHSHNPHNSHTGIVYAPQHQSYHEPHIKYLHQEPQYVKVVKPVHHQPVWQPQPWQPQPWQPPVHHIPKVELCD